MPQVRREVASRFKGLETDICPFGNLPEKKRTQWALTFDESESDLLRFLRKLECANVNFPDSGFVGLLIG